MDPPRVLVVGETPSLGRSIADLLDAGGVSAEYVLDVEAIQPLSELSRRFRVLVAASNSPYCTTGRRWLRGEMPGVDLVVVGSRDPQVEDSTGLHRVGLPLIPEDFLRLLRTLSSSDRNATHRSGARDDPERRRD